jgi:hypothetical protein
MIFDTDESLIPTCCICKTRVPEMDSYLTKRGKDYCNDCAFELSKTDDTFFDNLEN